eukprot:CAMPEP_0181204678 /NCGR_PEP_ID=MMETSP1096-20121128/20066_1 /TAXON_ID=156174 ORGANISM="Chrysochromulina ericina, Strain CCMP281" /NCGR_SAMPLE_ID=MMETSP1096 /ASSEMBLY_ACC=CAM_ASM_000453 /LENGTH=111 /DNA_ID=CAMNT_0023295399 /DNA_START=230 /DNA_END=566 /DNA_ORIENTATION=-
MVATIRLTARLVKPPHNARREKNAEECIEGGPSPGELTIKEKRLVQRRLTEVDEAAREGRGEERGGVDHVTFFDTRELAACLSAAARCPLKLAASAARAGCSRNVERSASA